MVCSFLFYTSFNETFYYIILVCIFYDYNILCRTY